MSLPAVAEDSHNTTTSSTWVLPFASLADAQGDWHTPTDILDSCPHLRRLFHWPCEWRLHRGSEMSLTPPHQWVRAWQLGWLDALPDTFPPAGENAVPGLADGALPWAAHEMAHLLQYKQVPAAWFTPCHQEVGMDHIRLHPPSHLALSEPHSRALMQALQPWAAEDGIALHWVSPTRWLAVGEPLQGLRCASLDRVVGRSIAPWLAASRLSPTLRRLQSEAQMLFYTHPVHDERVNSGALPVNAFWIDGNGVLPATRLGTPAQDTATWTLIDTLRTPAQQGDVLTWQQSWPTLDAELGAHCLQRLTSGQTVRLWLTGERSLLALTFQPMTRWQHWQHKLKDVLHIQRIAFGFDTL